MSKLFLQSPLDTFEENLRLGFRQGRRVVRKRVLPRLRLWHIRTKAPHCRTHVHGGQLVPGPSKIIREEVKVFSIGMGQQFVHWICQKCQVTEKGRLK